MKRIMETVNPDDDPVKLIRRLLVLNMEGMLENPILSQWYSPDVYNKIEKLFREEDGLRAVDFLYRDFHGACSKMAGGRENEVGYKQRDDYSFIRGHYPDRLPQGRNRTEVFPLFGGLLDGFCFKGPYRLPDIMHNKSYICDKSIKIRQRKLYGTGRRLGYTYERDDF